MNQLQIRDKDNNILETVTLKEDCILLVRDVFSAQVGSGFTVGFDQPSDYMSGLIQNQGIAFDDDTVMLMNVVSGPEITITEEEADTVYELLKQINGEKYPTAFELFNKIVEYLDGRILVQLIYE